MGKHRTLAILDYEKEYVQQLVEYMQQKEGFEFQILAFSENEKLKQYEIDHTVDILLCAESIAEVSASEYKAETICLLSDYNFIKEGARYPSIFKYQSAEEIIKEVILHYSEKQKEELIFGHLRKTKVIGVCSPSGGCFKSSFALALALKKAKKGETLFLSFDPFFTIPGCKKEERSQSLSDIIYYLKQNLASLPLKIKAVTQRKQQLDYISGVAHWIDLLEFTPEELRTLLKELVEHMSYETLVIDIGSFGLATMELLLGCDIVYVPSMEEKLGDVQKEQEWRRQIQFVGGEMLFDKLVPIMIPYDGRLQAKPYTLEQLPQGDLGDFIDNLEIQEEYAKY